MPDKAYEAAQSLWEKYRVLTHELMKFIDEEEIDTFIDLVDQRERIVDMLKELPADPYRSSEEWGALCGDPSARDADPVQGARVAEPLAPSELCRAQL